jgi:hypothetical protein
MSLSILLAGSSDGSRWSDRFSDGLDYAVSFVVILFFVAIVADIGLNLMDACKKRKARK